MKILKTERKLCLACMEEHDVHTVLERDKTVREGKITEYDAIYEYCERADELLETEDMIRGNFESMRMAQKQV